MYANMLICNDNFNLCRTRLQRERNSINWTTTQNGFSASKTPSGAGDLHPVFDQMPTGPFDDSCGDGQSLGEITHGLEQEALNNLQRHIIDMI
jgi:hypothetical protein